MKTRNSLPASAFLGIVVAAITSCCSWNASLGPPERPAVGLAAPTAAPAAAAAASHSQDKYAAIFTERQDLLMTAAAASAYANLSQTPPPGYDIAALIAWNVDEVDKTPEFVLGRNRNFELRGDIHHAEINTMRAAYEKKRGPKIDPSDPNYRNTVTEAYTHVLESATLYTTLEPCPMCANTMLLARVPKAIYFMEDPGLRDPKTHEMTIPSLKSVYGRTLKQERSAIEEAEAANRCMWSDAIGPPVPAYFRGPSGNRYFSITEYLTAHGKDLFGPSYEKLQNFKVQNAENQALYERLKKEITIH